jgi:hypothetical protein
MGPLWQFWCRQDFFAQVNHHLIEPLENSILEQLLDKHKGNKTKIASEFGLSRHGL